MKKGNLSNKYSLELWRLNTSNFTLDACSTRTRQHLKLVTSINPDNIGTALGCALLRHADVWKVPSKSLEYQTCRKDIDFKINFKEIKAYVLF